MENEVVDRSSGRNSRLCSDASETLLDSCIRQTVNEDISMPSVTSFIWCSLSFSFSFYFQQWNNLPWCLAVIFFFFSMYLFISIPSYQPRQYCDISTFPIFISLSFHSASQLISLPFFLILCSDFSAPASFITFHLFTLSLIITIMLSLMLASPRICP